MNLTTIIRQARSGELKSLSAKDKTDEVIIDFINLALVALYSRFRLVTGEAIISVRVGDTIYDLTDTDDTTLSDGPVMQILEAFDENGSIPINDDNDPYSIYTVGVNKVQVPVTADDAYISLIYRAEPAEVLYTDTGTTGVADNVVIALPSVLLEPLLHYIGYRAHGSVNGEIQAENNTHLMRFEASCKRITALALLPVDQYNRNVSKKGFL